MGEQRTATSGQRVAGIEVGNHVTPLNIATIGLGSTS
jgi:hypothetical protein